MRCTLLLTLLSLAPVAAQSGTETRNQATDYPISTAAKQFSFGAEYMIRSFGQHNEMFTTDEYLVVETAFFPQPKTRLNLKISSFRLRLNGKDYRYAQLPYIVANSIRYPDYETQRGLQTEAAVGPVILGRQRTPPRFPGDTTDAPRQRIPVPQPEHQTLSDRLVLRPDEAVTQYALPEGETVSAVSGYLYFPFKGKPGKIKSLELLYKDEAGNEFAVRLN